MLSLGIFYKQDVCFVEFGRRLNVVNESEDIQQHAKEVATMFWNSIRKD
jgi:hypothetical protein